MKLNLYLKTVLKKYSQASISLLIYIVLICKAIIKKLWAPLMFSVKLENRIILGNLGRYLNE